MKVNNEKKPKLKKGCLIGIIVLIAFLGALTFGITQIVQNPEKYGAVTTNDPQTLLTFDNRTWEDFKTLYKAHNEFMKLVDAYASGNVNALNFYNKCVDYKNWCQQKSLSFDYGRTQDEMDYLGPFKSAAISGQMAAQDLIKYIDTGKVSDMSSANLNIQNAKAAFTTIASNRGTLLVKAGLTDEEIKQKIDEDTESLK
ncbi:MAG: hypothetical protein Q8882_05290 [Bacillota bacterium]|nr:hypothetical protein [Bacillota bacterium]